MPLEQSSLFAPHEPYESVLPRSAPLPNHDGATYDAEKDKARLNGLMERVFALMRDGQWRTLAEIVAVTGGSEGGVGARLRDARKVQWGGHTVNRRRRGDAKRGIFEYQLVVRERA